MMEAESISETSVNFYETAWHDNLKRQPPSEEILSIKLMGNIRSLNPNIFLTSNLNS
jgi:hypothetical protein